jgi:transposase-like protein
MEQKYKTKTTKARKKKKKFKRYVKAGFCAKTGKQRWYDKQEKKYFLKEYSKRGYSSVRKKKAIALAQEGNGFRAIGRLLGISHTCAYYWIRDYAKTLETQVVPVEPHMSIELDEFWGFCQKKRNNSGVS